MKLSPTSERLIAECRWVAEKLENDYVGVEHFLLAYNKFDDASLKDLRLSISDKKELIKAVKGNKISGAPITGDFPLTKDFEFALFGGKFQKWILSDKIVEPKHIYLAILLIEPMNKTEYFNVLNSNSIEISSFKKLMIDIQFSSILRMVGVARLCTIFI